MGRHGWEMERRVRKWVQSDSYLAGIAMKRAVKGIGSVAKRRREEERKEIENSSLFEEFFFSAENVAKLRKEYQETRPFKHVLIENACNSEGLKIALDQALEHMKADLRESDRLPQDSLSRMSCVLWQLQGVSNQEVSAYERTRAATDQKGRTVTYALAFA
eukprot:753837-Hanusia_phi.AAC.1